MEASSELTPVAHVEQAREGSPKLLGVEGRVEAKGPSHEHVARLLGIVQHVNGIHVDALPRGRRPHLVAHGCVWFGGLGSPSVNAVCLSGLSIVAGGQKPTYSYS